MGIGDIKTKEYLIRQWVLWAYESRGLNIYFPSIEPFAKMQPRKANGLCINDAEGEALDRVVSTLKGHNSDQYDVFTLYHLSGCSLREVAKRFGKKDHKWAQQKLELAEQFFELMTLGPQSNRESRGVAPESGRLSASWKKSH